MLTKLVNQFETCVVNKFRSYNLGIKCHMTQIATVMITDYIGIIICCV